MTSELLMNKDQIKNAEQILHKHSQQEIKHAMNIILKEWCCYDEEVAASGSKHMSNKQLEYMNSMRRVLDYDYFDHIFFGKNGAKLIFEVHPYTIINRNKMKELSEFEDYTGIIVEVLPASYWNVGSTIGIRFIIDTAITSIEKIQSFKND